MHLPGEAVLDGGDDQAGAAQDDLPLRPLVQLRLALAHAEHALQQRAVQLVRAQRLLCGGEGGGGAEGDAVRVRS